MNVKCVFLRTQQLVRVEALKPFTGLAPGPVLSFAVVQGKTTFACSLIPMQVWGGDDVAPHQPSGVGPARAPITGMRSNSLNVWGVGG